VVAAERVTDRLELQRGRPHPFGHGGVALRGPGEADRGETVAGVGGALRLA